MSVVELPVIVTKVEDNYAAYCPDLLNCATTGQTPSEARSRLRDALIMCVKDMVNSGEDLPESAESVTLLSIPIPVCEGKAESWPERLKLYRKTRGYSQGDLAAEFEVTQTTVSQWESGKTDIPGTVKYILKTAS